MRIPCVRAFLLSMTATLSGCAEFLPTALPSFDGPFSVGRLTKSVPLGDIETQIQCEIKSFLEDPETAESANSMLDPEEAATVTFTYQSELDGKASFIGVDLAKVGLTGIANLITSTNKVPSLQASVQAKAVVSDADVFLVPQTSRDIRYVYNKHLHKPSVLLIRGLKGLDCGKYETGGLGKLFIKEWLAGKFDKNNTKNVHGGYLYGVATNQSRACRKQTNLKTSIALIFDASAGVNPLFAATYILPISGFTGDISPQFTATLEIDFAVQNDENNALCEQFVGRKGAIGLFPATNAALKNGSIKPE